MNFKITNQISAIEQQQGLVLAVMNVEEKRAGDQTKAQIAETVK